MTLKEFLQERSAVKNLDRQGWLERVRELLDEIRGWMAEYDQLELQDWNVLIVDGNDRYNGPALTIGFLDAQVTVQPKGNERRLEAVCGARVAFLEPKTQGWTYHLQDGRTGDLSKQTFADEVVKELLS